MTAHTGAWSEASDSFSIYLFSRTNASVLIVAAPSVGWTGGGVATAGGRYPGYRMFHATKSNSSSTIDTPCHAGQSERAGAVTRIGDGPLPAAGNGPELAFLLPSLPHKMADTTVIPLSPL
ncbi:hypothetical protein ACOMHN_059770 [Nucella lapillus]